LAKSVRRGKKKTQVDSNGIAHIKATFNNVVVTYMAIQYRGLLQERMVLKVQERTLHTLHRFQRKLQLKKHMI